MCWGSILYLDKRWNAVQTCLAHPAWHPSGAPAAGSVFTEVQKEIAEQSGITFTAPLLGRSLQGVILDEPRPNNSVTVFATEVREVNGPEGNVFQIMANTVISRWCLTLLHILPLSSYQNKEYSLAAGYKKQTKKKLIFHSKTVLWVFCLVSCIKTF